MGFDGLLVPDWAKPYIGWVVGMDWPEGDETGCFRLADACVTAAHRIVEGTAADQPWTADKIGSEWDGAAHLAFAEHVGKMVASGSPVWSTGWSTPPSRSTVSACRSSTPST
ncbi:hypothetical protein ACFQX6_63465 [Streptosporangium lutulentum]